MKYLGYIGAHLTHLLKTSGHTVIGCDLDLQTVELSFADKIRQWKPRLPPVEHG